MQSSASINLVKRRVNLLDETLKWALSVGRLLVILTEIVAFSTFIYRFSLDRTLIDLHSKIKQEQAIVGSLTDREKVYRNLQGRISTASNLGALANRDVVILNDIVKIKPPEILFNNLSITDDKITINCRITSISALSTFVSSLKEYPKISSVSIDNIDNKSLDNSISVSVTAKLKGGGI